MANVMKWLVPIIIVVFLIVSWQLNFITIPGIGGDKVSHQDSIITANTAEIDSLREVIGTLESNQKVYDSTITRLNDSILVISSQLTVNQSKIKDLRKKYNEKVDNVSSYSSDQLEEFLSGRYK